MDEGGRGGWGGRRGSPRGNWHSSPRYRGGYNNNNRGFSPRGGSPYRQDFYPVHPYATSTPIQSHRGHYRGQYSPSPRNQFHSFNKSQEEGSIDAWVSPAMWQDPWKLLEEEYQRQERTHFAPIDSSNQSSLDDLKGTTAHLSISGSTNLLSHQDTPQSSTQVDITSKTSSSSAVEETKTDSSTSSKSDEIAPQDLLTLITS